MPLPLQPKPIALSNLSSYPYNLRPRNQRPHPYFSTSCTAYNQPLLRTPDAADKRTSRRIANRPHNFFLPLFSPHVLCTVQCRSFQCDILRFNPLA
ncbi:hypothetical protein DYB28_007051 [Aphanomyces astaci]|uniref:Uncharacterized protein n=1 Tax=Aphanomyces astaci TaxID=112090 RepID=A0A9X8H5R7_APHAT|nr:hypothetical protein DYB28_007051 [Aphanomyces astaci]